LIDDPRFKDDISRGDNAAAINEVMSEWCASRTREEAMAELERARVPCGPVYDLDEVLADPQVRTRKLIQEIEYPTGGHAIPIASPPARLSESAASLRRAPTLGEHTNEVLSELAFSGHEIAMFREAGAV
jgi:crotonobetainyl-CoA:carnitine CoA-transferase CaiB-like acyl-CoA transferase